jgi:DNA-directed RNA polymerase specialized sigma24 family protein
VLREHWKKVEKHQVTPLEDLPVSQSPAEDPGERKQQEMERVEHELRLECLNNCVGALPKQHLEMVTEYHQEKGGTKIAQRNELAARLNIPLNALRIRVFRIREGLEDCVTGCVKKGGA